MVRTELVNAEDQDGLVDLESQDLGLDKGKRLSVDLDETLTGLDIVVSTLFECALDRGSSGVPCSGRQLLVMLLAPCSQYSGDVDGGRTSRGLLLAEALHALGSHVGRLWVCEREGGGRRFAVVSSSVGIGQNWCAPRIVAAARTFSASV
jgi:hypothetical protein